MGRTKAYLIEEQTRGYNACNTWVCIRCIEDHELRRFIRLSGDAKHSCSYCGKGTAGSRTVSFNSFVEKVLEGIYSEWSDPNDEGVPWEKGWVGEVFSAYELLHEEGIIEFRSPDLLADVQHSLVDLQFCQKNFYELRLSQALAAGWEEFTHLIKHKSRYAFLRRPDPYAKWRGIEEVPPSEFLDTFGAIVSKLKLYRKLNSGTDLFRVRVHKRGESFTRASELGPPPSEFAIQPNRMSAAGISAFYGAFDEVTALEETTGGTQKSAAVTVATFRTARDLLLVDFTKLPPMPSLFKPNAYSMRHQLRFLYSFLADFTAPISKDGREHINYVPTQVVAEYLNFVHLGPKKRQVDGILYKSSKNGESACILFIGQKNVANAGAATEKTALTLEAARTFNLKRRRIPGHMAEGSQR